MASKRARIIMQGIMKWSVKGVGGVRQGENRKKEVNHSCMYGQTAAGKYEFKIKKRNDKRIMRLKHLETVPFMHNVHS